ncbi:MAG: hypothetical protein U9P79_00770 [Candidatus Cloacimonadota bacterium]|nr:hypothetical protein [Candidatus Cloacimonadota bacterium]
MKKFIFITILLLTMTHVLHAGRYAGDFILIYPGVRPLGMGSSFTAVADEGSATFWNAAGLAQMQKMEVEMIHAFLYQNLANYDFFAFSLPLPAKTTLGVSFTQLAIDDIPVYDEKWLVYNVDTRCSNIDLHLTGEPDGYFSSADQVFKFAFSKNMSQIVNFGWDLFKLPIEYYLGGIFKYIKRDVYNHLGTGMGFDLAFLVKTDFALLTDVPWLGKIKFGVNVQDIAGTKITWDTSSKHQDEIITTARYGLALVQPLSFINSEILFAFDWVDVYDFERHLGAEFTYNKFISVRAGYSNDYSAGLGINYKQYSLDYAFIKNYDLGSTNRIGFKVKF